MRRTLVAALCVVLCALALGLGIDAHGTLAPAADGGVASEIAASEVVTADSVEYAEDVCVEGYFQKIPPFVRFIAFLLASMAAVVAAVGVGRRIALARDCRQLSGLERECIPSLRAGRITDALRAAGERGDDLGGALAGAIRGLGVEASGRLSSTEASVSQSSFRRDVALRRLDAGRGLRLLSTIGTTAPLLGLLATIVGITTAVRGMTTSEGSGVGALAGGISEAFVLAAFSIAVGLIAVWTNGYLESRASDVRLRLEAVASAFEIYCIESDDAENGEPIALPPAARRARAEERRGPIGVLGAWR